VSALLRAEVFKLRTTRTFWSLAAAGLTLGIVVTVISLAFGTAPNTEHDVRNVLGNQSSISLFLLIAGIVASAGEYRHGTISSTFLVAPDRLRVIVSQALAYTGAALTVAVLAAAIVAAIALPWLASLDAPSLGTGQVLGLFGTGALDVALAGGFGVALGAVLRNQVAGIVSILVLLFVFDPAVASAAPGYGPYSLWGIGSTLSGQKGTDDTIGSKIHLLPVWEAALLWAGYTLVLLAVATVLTRRRDIT
jgi:ABC-2 type transport system permease protein